MTEDSLSFTEDEKAELRNAAKRILEILDGKTAAEKIAHNTDWRDTPPSEKQLTLLKKKGYSTEGLTRGQASNIIDKLIKH